eukprot:5360378-Alexandrium_andersonii.AAC.1
MSARSGTAGSPAAREACGLPAPGAQPASEAVRLARALGLARAKLRLLGRSGQARKKSCCSESKG